MAEVFESPNIPVDTSKKSLFLAGGITGCPDWQRYLIDSLEDLDVILLNPRRENFPIEDPSAASAQIEWEHKMLRRADMISFWFCKEAIQPIALYELGAWSMTGKPIAVGMERRQDVEIQTLLARPGLTLVYDLDKLSDQIAEILNEVQMI